MGKRKKNPQSGPFMVGHGNWYGGSNNYNARTIHDDKRVRIVDKDGKVLFDVPAMGYSSDFDALLKHYEKVVEGEDKKALTQVAIVPEDLKFLVKEVTLERKKPMMCLYNSIKDYCESILGVRFTDEDRKFFEDHPLTQEDGVPFPDTLRVAQELIEPYGLGISRVQTKPNYGVKGDLLKWRSVLGCNPLALGDRITSNKEFIAKMNLQGKEDPDQYRFEYTEEALFPSVSCGTLASGSGLTGFTNGHAVYLPPRRRASGALLSFQIQRMENVKWKKYPQFAEVPADQKKVMTVFDHTEWFDKHKPKPDYSKPVSNIIPVVKEYRKHDDNGVLAYQCYMCNRKAKHRKHSLQYPGICDDCFQLFISEHFCATETCKDAVAYPHFRFLSFHAAGERVYVQCPGCHKTYVIEMKTPGKYVKRFIHALQDYMKAAGLKTYSVRSDWVGPTTPSTSVNNDSIKTGD